MRNYSNPFILKSFLIIVFILQLTSCGNEDAEVLSQRKCPFWGCSGKNICLKNLDVCVRPCEKDVDCPGDFLCKKYFKDNFTFSGRKGKFCFKATGKLNDFCTRYDQACGRDLACVDGICRRICITDDQCPEDHLCKMEVLSTDSLHPNSNYHVCALATKKTGDKCTNSKEPLCSRDNVCIDSMCRKLCSLDSHCPPETRCTGRGTSGWRGRLRYLSGDEPDFRYCQ